MRRAALPVQELDLRRLHAGHNDASSVDDSGETTMELRREVLTTEILDPRRDFAPTELTLEICWDPLTGHTSRILPSAGLLRSPTYDLSELAEQTRPGCPFCAERIEQTTPKLPPSI